jgi:DNA-binding NarL/FixJ family response regulator
VLLTLEESPVLAQHVLTCGALGYVLKDRADAELADAVRAAARGERYISPRVADRLSAVLRLALTEQ